MKKLVAVGIGLAASAAPLLSKKVRAEVGHALIKTGDEMKKKGADLWFKAR